MRLAPARRHAWAAAITVVVLATVFAVGYDGSPNTDALPAPAPAEPNRWPMFGGSNLRNLVNTAESGIATSCNVTEGHEENVKWSAALGGKAGIGPVISGGRIFVPTNNGNPRDPNIKGDKGVLMCFEEKTGKFLWQQVHNKLESGRFNDWPSEGIWSAPTVEGDRLYYVSNRSEVICARTDDGKIVWKYDMIEKLNNFPHNLSTCSPLVAGDTIFVVTSNGVDEGHINIPQPEAPSFIALDTKTGELKWQNNDPTKNLIAARKAGKAVNVRELVNKGELLMHGQWSNPVYAEPNGKPMIIFPGGDGWMRAFNPKNGELVWKFDCNPKGAVYELGARATRNDFVCTPVVWKDKLYIGVGQDPEHLRGVGHLWCIDITKKPANKDKDISPVDDNFDPKADVNKDSGLVWHYGGSIDPKPKKGRAYRFGRTLSTCAVHDGLVYAADFDSFFYCLDALTGELKYSHDTDAGTWSSPTWVDGHVYLGNEDGNVLVFKHGSKKELLSTIDMNGSGSGTRVRATPVACNGVLFIVTEEPCKLWAIAPKTK